MDFNDIAGMLKGKGDDLDISKIKDMLPDDFDLSKLDLSKIKDMLPDGFDMSMLKDMDMSKLKDMIPDDLDMSKVKDMAAGFMSKHRISVF